MITSRPLLLLLFGALAVACADPERPPRFEVPEDVADASFDAPLDRAVTVDASIDAREAGDVDTRIPCYDSNAFCPMGQICLGGFCAVDPCSTVENVCGADRCLARCVPVRDPCAGIRCGDNETCLNGTCVQGCYPAVCSGVTCPDGEYCSRTTGQCEALQRCSAACGEGFACQVDCVPPSPCDNVTCAAGEVCAGGVCTRNPCSGVRCTGGQACTTFSPA